VPPAAIVVPLLAGAAVALALGVYGAHHTQATQSSTSVLFWTVTFESSKTMLRFKAWFTTAALVLAVAQLLAGLRLRDHLRWPRQIPLWLGDAHRLGGTLVLLVSLPVAYHCLWSLGFQASTANVRVLIHSLLGCFFYGVYVTKVLAVRRDEGPGWFVPALGGTTFAALTGVWLTSALFVATGRIG
jgi:hypothetical protein